MSHRMINTYRRIFRPIQDDPQEIIQQAGDLTEELAPALEAATDRLSEIHAQIQAVQELPRCSGHSYYRDEDKLYANHGVGEDCPLHGEAEPGKRLRCYVGNDPDNQAEALRAMENYDRALKLKTAYDNLYSILALCINATNRTISKLLAETT